MADYKVLLNAIEKEMKYYSIPGCGISVIEHDKVSTFEFGYRDLETKKPFTANTISGIGSCSKSMTAFAAVRLAEKKLFDLDVPITSYIPGFMLWDEKATNKVTVRDMLCHITGVGGHDGTWPDNNITRVEFLQRLRYMEPNVSFRTLAQYSNVMYIAVGGIMEAVTGKKWEDIMQEEVFKPLEMNNTYCLMDEATQQENFALPYWWNNGLRALKPWNIDMAGPCGSIMSTVSDMEKWLKLQINEGVVNGNRLITLENFTDIHTAQISMEYPHLAGGKSLGYGLGWRVMDYKGHIVQQHTGKIEGYSAFQFYLEQEGCGAVFLQNLHAPTNPFIFTIQGILLDYFLKSSREDWVSIYTEKGEHAPEEMYHHLEFDFMPAAKNKKIRHLQELSAYTGIYENKAYGRFTIILEKGQLWLHEREVFNRPLTHFNGEIFQVAQVKEDTDVYSLPLSFLISSETGEVVGFKLPMEPRVKAMVFKKIIVK